MEMLSTLNESAVEMFDTLKESTNKQKNQAVLDSLGENADGELTYKGQDVGAPKLHILEAVVDYATTGIHTYDPMSLTVEADIPTNARAKRVEIPDVVNETDEFIALEDMVSKDPSYGFNAPYFIMYPKNKTGVMSKVAANVVFAFQTANSFYEAAANYAYDGKAIKIYYEIEE